MGRELRDPGARPRDALRYAEELRKRARSRRAASAASTRRCASTSPSCASSIDRDRAADLGLAARDIGTALRILVGGDEEVSRFRDPATNEHYDVRLRLEEEDRNRPDILDQLKLPGARRRARRAGSVASIEPRAARVAHRPPRPPAHGLGARRRRARLRARRAASTCCASSPTTSSMPPSYTTSVPGRSREMERTFDRVRARRSRLSIVFMYLILASQFESLIHPLTILLSLPLVGAVRAASRSGRTAARSTSSPRSASSCSSAS